MGADALVSPSYDDACLTEVMPSALAALGLEGFENPLRVPDVERIALLWHPSPGRPNRAPARRRTLRARAQSHVPGGPDDDRRAGAGARPARVAAVHGGRALNPYPAVAARR